MTKNYITPGRSIKLFLFSLLLVFGSFQSAKACHGLALVGLTQTAVAGGINIDANSDPNTCGCDPYWMEVEVTCDPNGFTGNSPIPSSGLWGTAPWYHSNENIANINADNCVLEPYVTIFVPYAQLCPGTQYYFRAREFVQ